MRAASGQPLKALSGRWGRSRMPRRRRILPGRPGAPEDKNSGTPEWLEEGDTTWPYRKRPITRRPDDADFHVPGVADLLIATRQPAVIAGGMGSQSGLHL